MQATVTFNWVKSDSPDVVKQTFIVSKDDGTIVSHQVLNPDVQTLTLSLDLGINYTASLTASNQFLDSDSVGVTFSTPPAPVKPNPPTSFTKTITVP